MSAQQLADRCAEIGLPIPRSVLANLESGRRGSVGVAELLVLARALRVPPVSLICPVGFEGQMEYLPGEFDDPYQVAHWISGEAVVELEDSELLDELPISRLAEYHTSVESLKFSLESLNRSRERKQSLTAEEASHGLMVKRLESRLVVLEEKYHSFIAGGDTEGAQGLRPELDLVLSQLVAERARSQAYFAAVNFFDSALLDYDRELRSFYKLRGDLEADGIIVPVLPEWIEDVTAEIENTRIDF